MAIHINFFFLYVIQYFLSCMKYEIVDRLVQIPNILYTTWSIHRLPCLIHFRMSTILADMLAWEALLDVITLPKIPSCLIDFDAFKTDLIYWIITQKQKSEHTSWKYTVMSNQSEYWSCNTKQHITYVAGKTIYNLNPCATR